MKSNPDKSKEERLASDVLALVDRFHEPASHKDAWHHSSRRLARMAVPVALEGLALLTFAHQLRARRRHS